MERLLPFLLRPVVLVPIGAAVIAATVWLCLPTGSEPAALTSETPRPATAVATIAPVATQQAVASDVTDWLAYMEKAEQLIKGTTPADRLYFTARHALTCHTIATDRKKQQAQASQQTLSAEMQQAMQQSWKEEDAMCADVSKVSAAQIAAQMEQAALAGHKDAQLYLLRQRVDAAGIANLDGDPAKVAVLTPQQEEQRERLITSVQELANFGHRDSMSLLADIKMTSAAQSGETITPFALSMLSVLDWSKPLPSSLSDEALMSVPEEYRGDVLRRAGEIYHECCLNAPNKNPYASPLDVLGRPPALASQDQSIGSVLDIFRVQRN